MGIYIPNMKIPRTCDECDLDFASLIGCEEWWVFEDGKEKRSPDCPLIEIDENDPMLLEFLNEFDKWRAYKEVMNNIKSVYKEGEANDIR